MIAAVLAGAVMFAALYFPARNHDDRLPLSVTGRRQQ